MFRESNNKKNNNKNFKKILHRYKESKKFKKVVFHNNSHKIRTINLIFQIIVIIIVITILSENRI